MKQFQYDDEDFDEFGVLKDGKSVRVNLQMADAAPAGLSFTDADEHSMADAYSRASADHNAWRGGASAHQPRTDHGTFAPMHRDQLTSADALDRAQAAADAAYAKSVSSLNEGRPQYSRASDAAEAMILADEAYEKSVSDHNAWRNRK